MEHCRHQSLARYDIRRTCPVVLDTPPVAVVRVDAEIGDEVPVDDQQLLR